MIRQPVRKSAGSRFGAHGKAFLSSRLWLGVPAAALLALVVLFPILHLGRDGSPVVESLAISALLAGLVTLCWIIGIWAATDRKAEAEVPPENEEDRLLQNLPRPMRMLLVGTLSLLVLALLFASNIGDLIAGEGSAARVIAGICLKAMAIGAVLVPVLLDQRARPNDAEAAGPQRNPAGRRVNMLRVKTLQLKVPGVSTWRVVGPILRTGLVVALLLPAAGLWKSAPTPLKVGCFLLALLLLGWEHLEDCRRMRPRKRARAAARFCGVVTIGCALVVAALALDTDAHWRIPGMLLCGSCAGLAGLAALGFYGYARRLNAAAALHLHDLRRRRKAKVR